MGELEELRGQLRADALVLVLEEYIRVIPLLRENSLFPIHQIGAAVFGAPEADVAPCCGRDQMRIFRIIRLGNAERTIVRA